MYCQYSSSIEKVNKIEVNENYDNKVLKQSDKRAR